MKFKRGYKYQVVEDCYFDLPVHFNTLAQDEFDWVTLVDNRIFFRAGYAWDGPSGPTYDTPDTLVPSLVHDGLYQLMREGVLPREERADADYVFYQLLIERIPEVEGFADHIRAFNLRRRYHAWYRAVRGFAGFAAAGTGKPVEEVR